LPAKEAIREDTSEGTGKGSNTIEDAVTRRHLASHIPGGHQVNHAGEETSLEDTQDETKSGECVPVLSKATI